MKYIFWIFLSIICIGIGIVGTMYVYMRLTPPAHVEQTVSPNTEVVTPTRMFALAPPSQSLSGTLIHQTGSVLHKTREAEDYVNATPSATILVGESIATGDDGTAVIDIPNLSRVTMGNNAEISFVNIFKDNSVYIQKTGKIQYEMLSQYPIAIRALHALIEGSQSTVSINIIDTDMAVIAQKGEIKLAIVDTDNNTHVYTIPEGKRANVDDVTRTVAIISPR